MAGGMLFPDIGGALSAGAQAGAASAQNQFLIKDRAARDEIAPLIPRALQGDREALNQIGTRHPDTLMKITPLLERADAATRMRAKEAAEWTTKAAMGVLSLPPEQRPAAYQAALSEGQRLGYQIDMPPQYDRAVEGRLNQVINQARPIADYFKGRDEGFDLVPSGGGGAAPPSAGAPPNREAFLQTITPHAMEVSKATGLDPRLVIAQSALETGYGQSAPGNNYFGVKSHGKPGGQVLATTEAGPNGMYGTRDSFRTYGTPGESARDYVEFLRTNSRYAPVLQAQGIDAQIEALGRSGYASDPQYTAKLRQIVQSLPPVGPQPAGREVAYGGNAAPMPQPPGIAQGDTAPPADASGTPIPTSDGGSVPREVMRMITPNLPPGTSLGRDRKTGLFKVQEGNFVVYDSNRNPVGLVPIPKAPGTGPFTGNSVEAQALNMLVANGTLTQPQAAELAAGKTIANPADGSVIFMTPSGLFKQAPGGQPMPAAPGGGAPAPAAPGAGMIPVTPPKPVQMTEGQSNAALYADRMREADAIIAANEKAGMSVGGRALEAVPGGVGNFLQADDYQLFEQARRNFINAVLRRESGAVIADTEFANAEKQYFPRPGDSKAVLEQKAANRRSAIEGIARAAGPAYKPQSAPPPAATSSPPAAPKAGDMVDGYVFRGGNPADPNSWSKVQ